ncbi:MAG: hypothetical protein DRN40_07955 [Thermoplasmata archaeon]|nr:MAG: hypothetical protein DRN40_07955 [Thermoplasmata archaeon]
MEEDRIKARIEAYRLKARFLEDLLERVSAGELLNVEEAKDWIDKSKYGEKLSAMDFHELLQVIKTAFPVTSVKAILHCIRYYLAL